MGGSGICEPEIFRLGRVVPNFTAACVWRMTSESGETRGPTLL